MSEQRAPRSRFDRDGPRNRSDRRSRSPARDSKARPTHRNGSSPARQPADTADAKPPAPKIDPAAIARAAALAAKLASNIDLTNKPKARPADGLTPRSTLSTPPVVKSPSDAPPDASSHIFELDGEVVTDIEVNHMRNRYTLTKDPFKEMIKEHTGADVVTRGAYYPDPSMATIEKPVLTLRVTASSREALDKAVELIKDQAHQPLEDLVDHRRFRRRDAEQVERDEFGRRKWPEAKIPINLEPIAGFNLRARVVGQGGSNVKYIQEQTRCKVQIKGQGSGFMEPQSQQESEEGMYLHVAGPRPEQVEDAKNLSEELLEAVKKDYEEFKKNGPQRSHHDRGRGNEGQSRGEHNRNRNSDHTYTSYTGQGAYGGQDPYNAQSGYAVSYGSYGGYTYGGNNDAKSPVYDVNGQTQVTEGPSDAAAQWEAWVQQCNANGTDPYLAYQQQYAAYFGQQMPSTSGYATEPPPPPPSHDPAPPPPPPPPAGSPGGYNSVPPPPGL
ncbi:hypothetical protein EJ04DRAFT_510417 [Polyplosphaeria fusca]|uniref:K Homology domain-containing protein n=1 Tax=Polyplosphaeria fusca TaxID=682080 RepID=A0A9P4V437_9PLEO|nr:hypothetical protein EJ04DRAFT_510417 [Polyplosphaeria fusca]